MKNHTLQFPNVFRMLKRSKLGSSASMLYLWLLFDRLKGKLDIIERTSCQEIAEATHDTKDAVSKQLQDLERLGFVSIDRYSKGGDGALQQRGDIRIWLFHPNSDVRTKSPRKRLQPGQKQFDFDAAEPIGTRQQIELHGSCVLDMTDPDELVTVDLGGGGFIKMPAGDAAELWDSFNDQ